MLFVHHTEGESHCREACDGRNIGGIEEQDQIQLMLPVEIGQPFDQLFPLEHGFEIGRIAHIRCGGSFHSSLSIAKATFSVQLIVGEDIPHGIHIAAAAVTSEVSVKTCLKFMGHNRQTCFGRHQIRVRCKLGKFETPGAFLFEQRKEILHRFRFDREELFLVGAADTDAHL